MKYGLLTLAITGLITWLIFGNPVAVLVSICVVLVMLPPAYDPAIQIKEWLGGDATDQAH